MTKDSLNDRINFYGLDRTSNSAFKGVSTVLDRRIDNALETFYASISGRANLAQMFDSPQHMEKGKSLQREHWVAVFRDGVDERFRKRSTRIGDVHAEIGLEPKWYIGAYAIVLEELIMEIVAPGWTRILPWRRAKAERAIALAKVALMDIDFALSSYFEDSASKARHVSTQLGSALSSLSEGKLTVSVDGFKGDYAQIQHDFNSAIGSLNSTIGMVIGGVESITTGASEIRSAADDLARRTEEQAANLEETAAAISQTTQNVQKTAETTKSARATIKAANEKADDGSAIVAEAVTAMDQIQKSSEEINNIISVIDSIAFQTNLLALNAGVEAARAGETGKGFAVVASEVRALAQRCAEAADEVKALITASSQHVTSGVDLVSRSGDAFKSITEGIVELSEAIQSIADSTTVQAENLIQINSVVSDIDSSTQQNAAMAEQCTAAATSLTGEAENLRVTVQSFDLDGPAGTDQYTLTHSLAA